MLMPGLTTLPQHDNDLANALFPEKHGKLPVNRTMYHERLMQKPDVTASFLIKADDSAVPTGLTWDLRVSSGPVVSEMNVSGLVRRFLEDIFELCRSYTSYEFTYQFFFNCNETVVVPALRKKGQDLIPFLPHLDAPSLLVKTNFPAFLMLKVILEQSFCREMMTGLDVILGAYKAGEGCPSLPQLMGKTSDDYISRTGTYTVEISRLGHAPILTSEQSIRMMAKNVCEALSVLHEAGLLHRDV
jgi:hypothetical protein